VDRNDWSGNLYSYHFIDRDGETEREASKAKTTAERKRNDWDSNLYSYHFIDKDGDTEKAAAKVRSLTEEKVGGQGRHRIGEKAGLGTQGQEQGDI